MASAILQRQEAGLRRTLELGKEHRSSRPQALAEQLIIGVYSHEWDETSAKFVHLDRQFSSKVGLRRRRANKSVECMVQRGACHWFMADLTTLKEGHFSEQWIIGPTLVSGSAARDLWPSLTAGMPAVFGFWSKAGLKEVIAAMDMYIFAPICDAASGNISILRHFGHLWEMDLKHEFHGRVLMIVDPCQAHLHHRSKLALACLREHTARHYGLAQLYKLPVVISKTASSIASLIIGKVDRVVQAPPPLEQRLLWVAFDVLFDMKGAHHDRKNGNKSVMVKDLEILAELVTGDPSARRIRHECWHTSSARPCCTNLKDSEERITVALLNVLMTATDRVPCQSRWTNLLPSLKRTLVRCLVHRIGIDAFLSLHIFDGDQGNMADPEAASFQ